METTIINNGVTIDVKQFLNHLYSLGATISKNTVIPILSGIYFTPDEMQSTNLESFASIKFKTGINGVIEYSILLNLFKQLNFNEVKIIDNKTNIEIISPLGTYTTSKIMGDETFPLLPNKGELININLSKFNYKYLSNFLSSDSLKYAMQAICIKYNDTNTTALATNSIIGIISGNIISCDNPILLPKSLTSIENFLKTVTYDVYISYEWIALISESISYYYRLKDAKFPGLENVYPSSFAHEILINGTNFKAIISRLKTVSKANVVRLEIVNNCITLVAENIDLNIAVKEQIKIESIAKLTISFNIEQLLSIFGPITDTVKWEFNNSKSASVISYDTNRIIIMPNLIEQEIEEPKEEIEDEEEDIANEEEEI